MGEEIRGVLIPINYCLDRSVGAFVMYVYLGFLASVELEVTVVDLRGANASPFGG